MAVLHCQPWNVLQQQTRNYCAAAAGDFAFYFEGEKMFSIPRELLEH